MSSPKKENEQKLAFDWCIEDNTMSYILHKILILLTKKQEETGN